MKNIGLPISNRLDSSLDELSQLSGYPKSIIIRTTLNLGLPLTKFLINSQLQLFDLIINASRSEDPDLIRIISKF